MYLRRVKELREDSDTPQKVIAEYLGVKQMLLCKQAAKIFQTICKKETALKRVLRNLLSAISFAQI